MMIHVVEKRSTITIEGVAATTPGYEGCLIRRDGAVPKLSNASIRDS
jgi:hypothetical protein